MKVLDPTMFKKSEYFKRSTSQDSAVLDLGSHIDISDTSFTQMQGDLDQQRLLGERPVLPSIDLHFSREVHDRER
ncbi:hypothetical protein M8J77_004284 [Diaphorina citri]|nr:hypothetical protein M8J77_004284 [Diaphorina citri]